MGSGGRHGLPKERVARCIQELDGKGQRKISHGAVPSMYLLSTLPGDWEYDALWAGTKRAVAVEWIWGGTLGEECFDESLIN